MTQFNGVLERPGGVVFQYLEVFYNRQRLHLPLGFVAPEVFEKLTIS
jgi:putative transposase